MENVELKVAREFKKKILYWLTRIIHQNIARFGTSDQLAVSYQINDAEPNSSNLDYD